MSPILSFTAEEIWRHLPAFNGKTESVFLSGLPEIHSEWLDDGVEERMAQVRAVREEVLKALEIARKNKVIGSSLEAQVRILAEGDLLKRIKAYESQWPTLLIVSQVVIVYELENPTYRSESLEGLQVLVKPAEGKKCERCWNHTITVGRNPDHPLLCERCVRVMGG
jgi:isoleucyl-tRNA synthetase